MPCQSLPYFEFMHQRDCLIMGAGRKGLLNLGASCYLSVVLQALIHNPLVRNWFMSDKHPHQLCSRALCLCCEMDKLLAKVSCNWTQSYLILPTNVTLVNLTIILRSMRQTLALSLPTLSFERCGALVTNSLATRSRMHTKCSSPFSTRYIHIRRILTPLMEPRVLVLFIVRLGLSSRVT